MSLLKTTILASALVCSACATAHSQPIESSGTHSSYISAENNLKARDELDIRQVISRLNHALDAQEYDLYASYFSQNGEFLSDFGSVTGRKAIAEALEQSGPVIQNKRHVAGNLVISGSGQSAVVTSYLVVFERTSSIAYVGSAVNIDTLEKRDGTWVVLRHESTLDPATAAEIQRQLATIQP